MNRKEQERLSATTEAFQHKKIAVIGDLMLDAYTWGKVSRISPEAPVPVVQITRRTCCLGGAANVMRNIVSLGAESAAFGVVGRDAHGEKLLELMKKAGIDSAGVLVDPSRPTTFKERIIAGSQQLLRLDEELHSPVGEELRETLFAAFAAYVEQARPDAVVIENYAKGLFAADNAQRIADFCSERGIAVTLDPSPKNPLRLTRLTMMKPNLAEAFAMTGRVQPLDKPPPELLAEIAADILKHWQVKYLLISLAEDGMALFRAGEECRLIPTRAKEVFDVSGAGDAVIAAATLALCVEDDPVLAAEIANYAAGIVVGKLGTAAVGLDELKHSFNTAM